MTELIVDVDRAVIAEMSVAAAVIATIEVTAGIGGPQGPAGVVSVPMTIRGDMFVGVGVVPFPLAQDVTVVDALVAMAIGPVGADLVFDILSNGVSIVTVTVPDGSRTSSPLLSLSIPLVAGDILTVDVLQVGSTVPGAYATIVLVVA